MHLTYASGQKALDVERTEQSPLEEDLYSTYTTSWKVLDVEIAK